MAYDWNVKNICIKIIRRREEIEWCKTTIWRDSNFNFPKTDKVRQGRNMKIRSGYSVHQRTLPDPRLDPP